MTREEAVEVLKERYLTCVGIGLDNHANRVNEALDMAIEALSEPSGDLISRADAIEVVQNLMANEDRWYQEAFSKALKALPSAEAVHGEWVRKYDDKINCYWYECDQCGEYRPRNQFGKEYNANFCPNCGADMRENYEHATLVDIKEPLRASADAVKRVDCSSFLLWLLEEIMDEDNWELNAVADGEIIARKLKKLGLLEVKDGYYHRIFDENVWVVRCKDCRHWNSETKGCKRNPSVEAWQKDDFCKYGKRWSNAID